MTIDSIKVSAHAAVHALVPSSDTTSVSFEEVPHTKVASLEECGPIVEMDVEDLKENEDLEEEREIEDDGEMEEEEEEEKEEEEEEDLHRIEGDEDEEMGDDMVPGSDDQDECGEEEEGDDADADADSHIPDLANDQAVSESDKGNDLDGNDGQGPDFENENENENDNDNENENENENDNDNENENEREYDNGDEKEEADSIIAGFASDYTQYLADTETAENNGLSSSSHLESQTQQQDSSGVYNSSKMYGAASGTYLSAGAFHARVKVRNIHSNKVNTCA